MAGAGRGISVKKSTGTVTQHDANSNTRAGVWDQIMNALTADHDGTVQMIDTSIVRVHQHGACIAANSEQLMGRSRGGLTTKIYAVVDTSGLPVRLALTTGEAHDNRLVLTLLSGLKSGAMLLADRGFDADWIRALVSQYGAWANIPPRRNRTEPICFSRYLYRARNLVERFFSDCGRSPLSGMRGGRAMPKSCLEVWLGPRALLLGAGVRERRRGDPRVYARRGQRRGVSPNVKNFAVFGSWALARPLPAFQVPPGPRPTTMTIEGVLPKLWITHNRTKKALGRRPPVRTTRRWSPPATVVSGGRASRRRGRGCASRAAGRRSRERPGRNKSRSLTQDNSARRHKARARNRLTRLKAIGAGERNRTAVISLERCRTIQ